MGCEMGRPDSGGDYNLLIFLPGVTLAPKITAEGQVIIICVKRCLPADSASALICQRQAHVSRQQARQGHTEELILIFVIQIDVVLYP